MHTLRRFFYASSACIYPEGKQLNTTVEGGGLKESDAWPAQVPRWCCMARPGPRCLGCGALLSLHCQSTW